MSLLVNMSEFIEGEWLTVECIRAGRVPTAGRTPDCYVTVTEDDNPVLRVDVFAYGPDSFAFQEAVLWQDNLIIGFGSYVHAVSLADHSVVTIALESYFGHLYPTAEYLLLASGTHLFRMELDRSILWQSELLGIDGVVVHEPGLLVVRGEGEWDPPGGWRPFAVLAANGKPTS